MLTSNGFTLQRLNIYEPLAELLGCACTRISTLAKVGGGGGKTRSITDFGGVLCSV